MASQHAQLIILAGPEEGLRIALRAESFPLTVGRSGSCGVCLSEPFISREHAVLDLADEGVVMVVRARRGVTIGERTYKAGTRVLLATGDVLALGGETELLFVEAGADVEAALAARQRPRGQRAKTGPADEEVRHAEAPPPAAEITRPTGGETLPPRAQPAPGEKEQARRKKRTPQKLIIGLGVYLVVIVLIAVALSLSRSSRKPPEPVPVFAAHQVERMLSDPLGERKRELQPNSQEAARALQEARQRFMWRQVNPADRYWCVYQYQRYLQLSSRQLLSDIDDRQRYDTALAELLAEVTPRYLAGCDAAKQERWPTAIRNLEAIVGNASSGAGRRIEGFVPDQLHPLNVNVQKHLRAIEQRRKAGRTGRRGPLGM